MTAKFHHRSDPIAICALIRRSDGRFLLIRRAEGIPGAGYWCPITGRPHANEALTDAVAREVFEEVGLRVDVGEEIFQCPTNDGSFLLRWFACQPTPHEAGFKPLSLDAKEVAEARWLCAAEASIITPTFDAPASFFKQRALEE